MEEETILSRRAGCAGRAGAAGSRADTRDGSAAASEAAARGDEAFYVGVTRRLADTMLFRGIDEDEISAMLSCLQPYERSYQKGEAIYRIGDVVHAVGVVLEGSVRIERTDAWGATAVLALIEPGDAFAESYACAGDVPLLVNVMANEPTRVLFLDVSCMMLPCSAACGHHGKLAANLLALTARKNIALSQRSFHVMPRTIRGKLLAYLSTEAARAGSRRFTVPFTRQQLADYLGVDRSALSAELGRMQREGLLRTDRRRFELLS